MGNKNGTGFSDVGINTANGHVHVGDRVSDEKEANLNIQCTDMVLQKCLTTSFPFRHWVVTRECNTEDNVRLHGKNVQPRLATYPKLNLEGNKNKTGKRENNLRPMTFL